MHITLVYSKETEGKQVLSIFTVPAPSEVEMSETVNEQIWFERAHAEIAAPVSDDLFVGFVFTEVSFEGVKASRVVIGGDE